MIGVSVTASASFQHFPPAEMKAGWQGYCCAVDIVASSLKVNKENIKPPKCLLLISNSVHVLLIGCQ